MYFYFKKFLISFVFSVSFLTLFASPARADDTQCVASLKELIFKNVNFKLSPHLALDIANKMMQSLAKYKYHDSAVAQITFARANRSYSEHGVPVTVLLQRTSIPGQAPSYDINLQKSGDFKGFKVTLPINPAGPINGGSFDNPAFLLGDKQLTGSGILGVQSCHLSQ